MKKITFCLLAVILMVSLLIGGCAKPAPAPAPKPTPTPAPTPSPKSPIKIGYIENFTGIYATMGVPSKKGMTAYIDWLNKQGGIDGHKVELIYYDSESQPDKARLAFKKSVESDNVHVVMGGTATGIAMAIAPAAPESKIAFVATSGAEVFEFMNMKAGPEQHKWNFRPHAGNSMEKSLSIASYMDKKGLTKIAFFTPESSFGKGNLEAALKILPAAGNDVVLSDTYPADATTFGHLISKLKAHPEIELIGCYGAEMAGSLASVAIKEAGFGDKLIIFNTLTSAEQLKLEKVMNAFDGLEGVPTNLEVWETLPDANLNKPVLIKLNKIWGEAYPGEKIRGTFDTSAIQGMIPIEDSFKRLLKDRPDILEKDLATIRSAVRDYLEKTPTYSNGTNMISLSPDDHSGSILGTNELFGKFSGGKWTYLSGGMTDPEYVRLFRELGPKVGWRGPITELAK